MSSVPSVPIPHDEVLKVMRASIVPALKNQTCRVVPSPTAKAKSEAGFQEIFPFGTGWHDCFEWVWVSESWTHVKVHNSIYQLRPGDVCLIAPGVPHAEMFSAVTSPHVSLWFAYHADTATIHVNLYRYDSVGHGQIIQSCCAGISAIVGTILVTLQSEIDKPQPHANEVCNSLLSLLTHLSIRALEGTAITGGQGLIFSHISRQVIDYLQQHYSEDVSLEEVARVVRLSRNYLATVFKEETGKTVGQTLTEIRLQHAKLLLVEQRRTVRDVAAAVGFHSPEHFCRVFQRYEKVSPSSYCK